VDPERHTAAPVPAAVEPATVTSLPELYRSTRGVETAELELTVMRA